MKPKATIKQEVKSAWETSFPLKIWNEPYSAFWLWSVLSIYGLDFGVRSLAALFQFGSFDPLTIDRNINLAFAVMSIVAISLQNSARLRRLVSDFWLLRFLAVVGTGITINFAWYKVYSAFYGVFVYPRIHIPIAHVHFIVFIIPITYFYYKYIQKRGWEGLKTLALREEIAPTTEVQNYA
jgi:hypothetical protein